jgi:subtilisin-like proprotein convertase family protein
MYYLYGLITNLINLTHRFMKKITLLFLLVFGSFLLQAQNYKTLTEANNAGVQRYIQGTNSTGEKSIITQTSGRALTATFADRPTFQAAVGVALTYEDFAGGPVACIQGCDDVMNDAGGACYPPGELQPGFELTASPGAGSPRTVFVAPCAGFGNDVDMILANFFTDTFVLNFTSPVDAFGFDFATLLGGPSVDISVFGTGGLIATFNVNPVDPATAFFGATADELITSVTILDPSGGAEGIGQLEFGLAVIGDPPVISCPADQMLDTNPGVCTAIATWADAIALDTEDGPIPTTQTMGPPSGSMFPVGNTLIEYSATDSDGNTSTCQFTITVTDNEAPVAICQDLTVELDTAGMYTITPADIDNGSSDNCGIVLYELGIGSPPVSGTLETLYAGGNGGANGGAVYFDLTVGPNDIDITAFDVNTPDPGAFTLDVYTLVGTSVGNETNMGLWTLSGTGSGTGAGGGNPSTATLAASFSLSASTTYGIALVLDATHNFTYTNGNGGNQAYSNADLSLALGQASNVPFTAGIFSPRVFNGAVSYDVGTSIVPFSGTFDCSNVGANTITLIVTDTEGNSSSCTSTVTVEDNIAPEIVCIGEQVVGPNTVSDAPGTAIVDNTTVSTTINVTEDFVITDLNVDMNITHTWVGDLQITLESPLGTQVLIFDGGNDGCSGDNINDLYDDESANPLSCVPASGDAFPLADYMPSNALSAFDGENTIGVWTLFVQDTAGGDQGTIDSWSLIYDFDPIVAPPLDIVLDANGMATINASDLIMSVNEACGYTVTVDGPPLPMSLSTTLAGGNGNFGNMFDVNALSDISIDSFDVHGEDGVTFDVEVWAKTGTWVGSENSPGDWTLIGTAPGVVSNGSGVVTPLNLSLGYTMAAGETHAFYVTPIDPASGGFQYTNGTTVGAVFAADANIEFLEGAGNAYPFGTTFQPRIFNGNIVYSTGATSSTTLDVDCSMLGLNTIEVTVTDDSGNVDTCTATYNVIDDTDPILVCMDATIELGPDGTAVVDPMALLGVMPSSYEVITISSDNQSGTPGNTDFTAPVTDAAAITFDWAYSTADGPAFDSFGYLLNGVYTELTNPGGANNQTGSAAVAVNPGDVFGFRSASTDGVFGPCTTVVSNFVPGFSGQFDPANWTLTLNNSDGTAYFVEIPGGPLSYDACGITILAVDVTEVTCADIGTPIVVTVFASDASGNIAACTSTVTVVDLLAPVVTCPADITVDPGPGNLFYEVPDYFATGEATAEDNCTDPLTILSQDPAAGTLLPDGVYPVTMTAEDEYGNVGTCTFTLTIESVLGVDENALDVAIVMHPNPAQHQVTISNSSNIQLEKATIFDLNGKLISQTNLSNMVGEKVIDVSELAVGVYIVQISSDNVSAIKRLIKE